jgi:hypothetical protein
MWLELNVQVQDDKFNDLLKSFVKPLITKLYIENILTSWHFFREPQLCLRLRINKADENYVKDIIKGYLKDSNDWYYGAFCEKDKEYINEEPLYGKDAMELCYKRWESGANLALQLCTNIPEKSIPFHYTRDIHLLENQLGFDYSDAIIMYLKWTRKLMECEPEKKFAQYTETLGKIILETYPLRKMEGI